MCFNISDDSIGYCIFVYLLMSEGFDKVVSSLMMTMDNAFQNTRKSQDELGKEIERLIAGKRGG